MKKKTKFQKWKTKFTFQAVDEASFEEKFSIRTSWLQVSVIGFSFFLLVSLLTFVLLGYTPLNYLLPSWRETTYHYQYRKLLYQIDSLEQKLDKHTLFLTDLQKWLTGTPFDEGIRLDTNLIIPQEIVDIPVPLADSVLRKEMQNMPLIKDGELERYAAKLFLSSPIRNIYKISFKFPVTEAKKNML